MQHEPTRSNDDLEAVFADLLARHQLPASLKVLLAYAGLGSRALLRHGYKVKL